MRISRLGVLVIIGFVAISAAWLLTPSRQSVGSKRMPSAPTGLAPLGTPTAAAIPFVPKNRRYVSDEDDIEGDGETNSSVLSPDVARSLLFSVPTPIRRLEKGEGRLSSELRESEINDGPQVRTNIFEDMSRAGEGRDNQRLFGLRSGGGGIIGGGSTDGVESDPGSVTNNPQRQRVGGQSRGYSMLYLMNQRARPVVEQQVNTLLRSQVNDLHIGVLVDGTFGQDYQYLREVITRLNADGRTLLLTLYLVSGPTMRDFDRTPIRTLFSQIDPLRFRTLITTDRNIRSQFVRIARAARPTFEYNKSLNPKNINVAAVMLEDNLDRSSYRAMRSLAAGALGDIVQFFRNPCVGCFTGNDRESFGDSLEEHTLEGFEFLGQGDGFSLDGTSFNYPGEPPSPGLSSVEVGNLIDQGNARGLAYFGLWRFNWQGIQLGAGLPDPDQRAYVPSTISEQEFEISLLRRGLVPVAPTPTPLP